MARPRTFTDKALRKAWDKHKASPQDVADALGVTFVTVYKHAARLGLSTQTQLGKRELKESDKELVEWFTYEHNADELADRLGCNKQSARYELVCAAQRLWVNNNYPKYPRPHCPTDVQVFNCLRMMQGKKDDLGAPLADSLDTVAEQCALPLSAVSRYHTRYINHQIELDEAKLKSAVRRKGKRSRSAKAGVTV